MDPGERSVIVGFFCSVITFVICLFVITAINDGLWERQAIAKGHGKYVVSGRGTKFEWLTVKAEGN